jgi:cell division protein FtsW
MVLLFFSCIDRRYFWGLVGVAAVSAGLLFCVILYGNINIWRFPTWKARVESWIEGNPNEADQVQVNNARMAVASGGIIGRGPGNGHAKVKLANVHCDYIFANIVEEVGLVGGMFLMWLYIMLFYRAISTVKKINKLSKNPDDLEPKYKFRQYLVLGLTSMMVLQALSNMAVSTDLIPVTGQTMPFVSYGTSSLLSMGVAMGIILSVSREVENDTNVVDKKAEPQTAETVATADGNTEAAPAEENVEVIIDDEDNGEVSGRDVLEMINDNELNIEENERK